MKDLFIDFIIGIGLFLLFILISFGIVGWFYAIFLVFHDNNWIPLGILCTIALLIVPCIVICRTISNGYKRFKATEPKFKDIILWDQW